MIEKSTETDINTHISCIDLDFSSSYLPTLLMQTLYMWNRAMIIAYNSIGIGAIVAYMHREL